MPSPQYLTVLGGHEVYIEHNKLHIVALVALLVLPIIGAKLASDGHLDTLEHVLLKGEGALAEYSAVQEQWVILINGLATLLDGLLVVDRQTEIEDTVIPAQLMQGGIGNEVASERTGIECHITSPPWSQ